ncbi:NUDIX domain-containing protein [Paenibacillus sp. ALJ109b]|uniref:NUDIX domain-containing protein n=1 Tax=Paenibacillus sp. ALJ109b TaxID=2709068 RepID=UPI0013D04869|nr:NUDIX domain-containing protein [Paenibacillus sp. ALJ109b]NEU60446.1 NUDIX domain-containing protein [Paenibacillus sp. ALJ109b]
MIEKQWLDLSKYDELEQEIQYVIMVTQFQEKYVIIHNLKRQGWEFPGGNREPDESVLRAAERELFEETGALRFMLEPFGIYQMNGTFGMVYYANITKFRALSLEPNSEIGAMKMVDTLPEGMNFGDMFYSFLHQWKVYSGKGINEHFVDLTFCENNM